MPVPNSLEKYVAKRVRTALNSGKWKEYQSVFEKVANDYSNVTWQDICVTGAIESGFNPNAHNSYGFTGMFQTKIGNVAPNVRSKYGVSSNSDLYDVEKAAGCCAAHLSTVFSQAIKRLSNRSDISQNIKKVLGWSEYHRGYKDGGVLYELITHNLSFEDAVIKANPMRPTDPDGTYVVTILDALEYLGGASFSLSDSGSPSNTGFTGLTEIPPKEQFPWFNDQDIERDEEGKLYANISLMASLRRFNLVISVGGGPSGGIDGITLGNMSFGSMNLSGFSKYNAGVYIIDKGVHNRMNMFGKFVNIPQDFMATIMQVSKETQVPPMVFIFIALSESGFKDCPNNNLGYGGYFGQANSYGRPLAEQAKKAIPNRWRKMLSKTNNNALNALGLTYVHHHLPVIGENIVAECEGRLWRRDPDDLASLLNSVYNRHMRQPMSSVRLAEAMMCNLYAGWVVEQVSKDPQLQQYMQIPT